ncbi:MAG: Fur family transcriptional regulator [Gemmatimonadota bacterium]
MKAGSEAFQRDLLERFRRWLRDRHLPVTRQRDAVAKALFEGDGHLSVEELQRRLREQHLRVGTATIYRSLDVLLQSGLVRAHDFGEGFKRYEATTGGTQHGHLICGRCGGVTEFSTERFERILPIVADEHSFQYQRHRVEVHGLCHGCREADYGAMARAGRAR